ncbi:hypothetical protein M011DRAFT_471473 [Sporormia fimetaria CBS 119925]|uniref:Tyrosine specific protein phosphatases domain-containing protein n=1 Tax=Sporormia fimetaria CBS 119925 TaxID=1340428 RepID=A0A6A6UYQ8_9PLEO|nr:hypothetical protein M011DRAFT_471473 [Sporormia fimetaria CBS 119925]
MSSADPTTLPQPPFIPHPNINNLRDAALAPPNGLLTSTSQKIRRRILYRSAEVSRLTSSDWSHLRRTHNIGHVFDLRSTPEVIRGFEGVTDPSGKPVIGGDVRLGWMEGLEAAGVKRHWVPVFEESDYSPERLAERYVKYMSDGSDGFAQAYRDILGNAGRAYGEILRYLAGLADKEEEGQKEASGILVHCTAGKDRTGIFFGVLFSFLGVGDQDIADEYNLTELGLAHVREDVVQRLADAPAFKEYAAKNFGELSEEEMGERGREAALRMWGARKESMLQSLKMVRREFGSAEGYLRSVVGLGDGELEGLRRALLVDGEA